MQKEPNNNKQLHLLSPWKYRILKHIKFYRIKFVIWVLD